MYLSHSFHYIYTVIRGSEYIFFLDLWIYRLFRFNIFFFSCNNIYTYKSTICIYVSMSLTLIFVMWIQLFEILLQFLYKVINIYRIQNILKIKNSISSGNHVMQKACTANKKCPKNLMLRPALRIRKRMNSSSSSQKRNFSALIAPSVHRLIIRES